MTPAERGRSRSGAIATAPRRSGILHADGQLHLVPVREQQRPRVLPPPAPPWCAGVPPRWCYALCTPLCLARRFPYNEGDENDGTLTLTLHKIKDTKNRSCTAPRTATSSRASTSTRPLWATFHRPRSRWSYHRSKPRSLAGKPPVRISGSTSDHAGHRASTPLAR